MIKGILCQTKKRVRSILKNLKLEFKQMVATFHQKIRDDQGNFVPNKKASPQHTEKLKIGI